MSSLFPLAVAVVVPAGLISLASWIRHRPKPSALSGDLAEWDREMREWMDAAGQERAERVLRGVCEDVTLDDLLRGDEA